MKKAAESPGFPAELLLKTRLAGAEKLWKSSRATVRQSWKTRLTLWKTPRGGVWRTGRRSVDGAWTGCGRRGEICGRPSSRGGKPGLFVWTDCG